MGMLDRIKRRQLDGFKEFVQNMEITGIQTRQQIFTAGVLEDPVYMTWVMKNTRTFEHFKTLPSSEIETVLNHQEQVLLMFTKCYYDSPHEEIMALESVIPGLFSRFKDEFSYLKDVTVPEKESARYFMVKTARKLQMEDLILGFGWQLPPMDVFYAKTFKEGKARILFDSGVLAAEGDIEKGRRFGYWKHYYDSGKLLAEGDYLDGLKDGVWVYYYGNGNIKAQGRYSSDLKTGKWQEWDRSGKKSEAEFNEGVRQG